MIYLTKVYMVRHCEALGNVMRIFQGITDLDITEIGEKQLKCLEKRFENIELDKIYSSPLIRAYKTALAIKGNRSLEVEVLDGLTELNGGFVEGKPFLETFNAHPEMKDAWFNHPEDFAPEGGEAMRDAYVRSENAFWEIVKNNKSKTVAFATHGGVLRCILCRFMFNDITRLKDAPLLDNTAVCYLEVDDDFNVDLKYYNDSTHLPQDLIPQRSRLTAFMGNEVQK